MLDSTHIKAHRSAAAGKGGAEAGCRPLARRAQHYDAEGSIVGFRDWGNE
jgi:hypothetical protein